MPDSVSDWIIAVVAVFVMSGAFLYALGVYLIGDWRRRRGVAPSEVNPVYLRRAELAARLEREQHAVRHAERIAFADYQRVAPLYEEPTTSAPSN